MTSLRSCTILLIACLLLAIGLLFSPRSSSQAQTSERCFPETGYCIAGRMREFWEQNGGLPVFGFPITPQQPETVEGQMVQVQWFERNRLELHPENARPYDVLLGRLGADHVARQSAPTREDPQSGCRYFDETGFNVCGDILTAWRAGGLEFDGRAGKSESENLALFGLPLTGSYAATSSEGQPITVQWFERARFELHPNNAPPYNVLLGLLGVEVSPTRQANPTPGTESSGRITFMSDREGNYDIYVMNADGSGVTRLTNSPAIDGSPAWSPDGTRIAFDSWQDGNYDIYVMNADGSGVTRLTNSPAIDVSPAWSPDGTRIVFASDRAGNQSDIYSMRADGSEVARLTTEGGSGPAWSPDGGRIAFSSERDMWHEVPYGTLYVMQSDGSGETRLRQDLVSTSSAAWASDGTRIAFNRVGGDISGGGIFVMNANGSGLSEVATPELVGQREPTWSPDNLRIAFSAFPAAACCDFETDIYVMQADGSGLSNLTNHPANDRSPDWSWR